MILIKEIAQQAFNQNNLAQITREQSHQSLTTKVSKVNVDCYYCLFQASKVNQSKPKTVIN